MTLPPDRLALWGGVECTVNRVGDAYRDQMRLSGHDARIGDLAEFAKIGISKLRYPVLWERVAADLPHVRDWRWSDRRISEIARLGMSPILGMLHHGSGPSYTDLIDDDFPRLFADYAGAVVERYPYVEDWTPINEPLTTARFSALYGHWYPHARDPATFWRALLNQIDATRLAMAAIRRVNPKARLIQTEDLGETFSAEPLAEVAHFYNQRRWLTWDLLCGRVLPDHPLWQEIADLGLADRLRAIADRPCPPDIVGLNYYVTSNRYLDRNPTHGPLPATGYHDHVAARAMNPPPRGLPSLLAQAYTRYGIPIALTECHIGCTRDEQMRWTYECWRACAAARDTGIHVVAFTAWALTGSTDWDSLLTRAQGHRESGVFEPTGGTIRPTAQARLLERLHAGDGNTAPASLHPVLAVPGWWRRSTGQTSAARARGPDTIRPLLIAGATGTLGRAMAGACVVRGINYVTTDRAQMAVSDVRQIGDSLDHHAPWAVVNATGWVGIDSAETQAAQCHAVNGAGAVNLARACDERGIPCMTFSSDQVFDGRAGTEYCEFDLPQPLNVYGASKRSAEKECSAFERSIIVRTAAFFSPYDPHNFAMQIERDLRAGSSPLASDAHIVSPTYVPHLVNACLDLLIDEEAGIWHLSNGRALSWLSFARSVASHMNLEHANLRSADEAALGWVAPRPRYVGLASSRGRMLPDLQTALDDYRSVRTLHG